MAKALILTTLLIEVLKALEASGALVRITRRQPGANGDGTLLTIDLDGTVVELDITERRHSPYPTDAAKLAPPVGSASGGRRPMLVAPFVSPRLGDALVDAGWSWADATGNFDIKAPGVRLRQRVVLRRPPRTNRVLPGGTGSTAVLRWLLSKAPLGEPIEQSVLASAGGVSQPRISQLMQALARMGLVSQKRRKYVLGAIEPLLDAFLSDYRGPGDSVRFAYTLQAPAQFAVHASDVLRRAVGNDGYALSADVGPDLLASWRNPTHTVLYLRESVTLDALGVVDARGREDANVLVRMPSDMTVFSALIHRTGSGEPLSLVDVPQMMWDLLDLGGDDRHEAAGRLREWFIQHRSTS